jgi:hypothetical protein
VWPRWCGRRLARAQGAIVFASFFKKKSFFFFLKKRTKKLLPVPRLTGTLAPRAGADLRRRVLTFATGIV